MAAKMKVMVAEAKQKSPTKEGRGGQGTYVRLGKKERRAVERLSREREIKLSEAFRVFFRRGARAAGYLEPDELELLDG